MAKHGKKYLAALAKVDENHWYTPEEAVALVKETAFTKFDSTIEIHMRLGVDPRHADQQVRDVVVLPHGLGKSVRVLVFAQGDGATLAREAGADFVVDDDETVARIQAGWTDFDVSIATPDLMGKVGRLGRVLGPRGLMPNPKAGTVVPAEDIGRVVLEAKAGAQYVTAVFELPGAGILVIAVQQHAARARAGDRQVTGVLRHIWIRVFRIWDQVCPGGFDEIHGGDAGRPGRIVRVAGVGPGGVTGRGHIVQVDAA